MIRVALPPVQKVSFFLCIFVKTYYVFPSAFHTNYLWVFFSLWSTLKSKTSINNSYAACFICSISFGLKWQVCGSQNFNLPNISVVNQVCTGHRPVCTWFLNIVSVWMSVWMHVSALPPRPLITSGMMWCDMNPYDWLKKFYSCYIGNSSQYY